MRIHLKAIAMAPMISTTQRVVAFSSAAIALYGYDQCFCFAFGTWSLLTPCQRNDELGQYESRLLADHGFGKGIANRWTNCCRVLRFESYSDSSPYADLARSRLRGGRRHCIETGRLQRQKNQHSRLLGDGNSWQSHHVLLWLWFSKGRIRCD